MNYSASQVRGFVYLFNMFGVVCCASLGMKEWIRKWKVQCRCRVRVKECKRKNICNNTGLHIVQGLQCWNAFLICQQHVTCRRACNIILTTWDVSSHPGARLTQATGVNNVQIQHPETRICSNCVFLQR